MDFRTNRHASTVALQSGKCFRTEKPRSTSSSSRGGSHAASTDADGEPSEFALAGQFISLLLCVGHVKSTKPADEGFVKAFSGSPKWLAMRT